MARIEECLLNGGEEVVERLELIQHKLRFTDAVPAALYWQGPGDDDLPATALQFVKGQAVSPAAARYAIVAGGKDLGALMGVAYGLKAEGEFGPNTQVVVIKVPPAQTNGCERLTGFVEDCADMLHAGNFYFGGEGERWLRLMD